MHLLPKKSEESNNDFDKIELPDFLPRVVLEKQLL